MTPLGEALSHFLSSPTRAPAEDAILDALNEYAWCSLAGGKRVREWSTELAQILSMVSPHATILSDR